MNNNSKRISSSRFNDSPKRRKSTIAPTSYVSSRGRTSSTNSVRQPMHTPTAEVLRAQARVKMEEAKALFVEADSIDGIPAMPDVRDGGKLPPATLRHSINSVKSVKCCATDNHGIADLEKKTNMTKAELHPVFCQHCIKHDDIEMIVGWAFITKDELETTNLNREMERTQAALKETQQEKLSYDRFNFSALSSGLSAGMSTVAASEADDTFSIDDSASFYGTNSMASPVSSFYGSRAAHSEAAFNDTASSVAWLGGTDDRSDDSGYEDEEL